MILRIIQTTDKKFLGHEFILEPEIDLDGFLFEWTKDEVFGSVHILSNSNYIVVAEEVA